MKIATLAIITRGSQILLGRKQGNPEIGGNTLNGPGGKFESKLGDRTILGCLFREVVEEFGIFLDLTKTEKVAVITFHAGGIPDFEVHVYRTSSFTGEPRETDSMKKPEWHNIDALPFGEMLESDEKWFPRLLKGEKFCAKAYYQERAKGFLGIDFLPFTD